MPIKRMFETHSQEMRMDIDAVSNAVDAVVDCAVTCTICAEICQRCEQACTNMFRSIPVTA